MSKTTTNQNETQTETEDMLKEDQDFQETEIIDEAEKVHVIFSKIRSLKTCSFLCLKASRRPRVCA